MKDDISDKNASENKNANIKDIRNVVNEQKLSQ
jgi:hypothetical protein